LNSLIVTNKRTIFRKVRTETILKICNTLVMPTFYMGQKIGLWQPYRDEELKRQKWSYWGLWQATPFMTTKQTTPYAVNCRLMHTRQDRWIQTELAFTLAKNATKPNPFEIISLQTTRKENNWKTEETLARAVITLETERIKGSNPW